MKHAYQKQQRELVEHIAETNSLIDPRVLRAFGDVPRHKFVSPKLHSIAYADAPRSIGNRQTISQPSLVALMTHLLNLKGADRVLEIGTGSGYQAAILSRLAKDVYTIERIKMLSARAEKTIKKLGFDNVHFFVGDGSQGIPKHAPFDAIIVTAGAKEIPQPLVDQLKIEGRIVIPVGPSGGYQELVVGKKTKTGLKTFPVEPVRFVPLVT